jgi:hypothetical protein
MNYEFSCFSSKHTNETRAIFKEYALDRLSRFTSTQVSIFKDILSEIAILDKELFHPVLP